ncbi:MAG TPA: amidohydrolase family protein [Candidatus Limnocylindrales bacterium]|nr:amidohydrolase family protein [Candidatus Limnocylindrales bacterium]
MPDQPRLPLDPRDPAETDAAPADKPAGQPPGPPHGGVSRRDLLKGSAAAGVAAALAAVPGSAAAAPAPPGRSPIGAAAAPGDAVPDLVLLNGRIHTMDAAGTVARAVAVRDGRIAAVGDGVPAPAGATVINLKGRTVVPGLIESHTHFVSLANRPGYHVAQLELATSIAEVQALLADRRARGDVPDDAFITAMGGWHPRQWAENRLPTLAELDEAVADRPVFLFQGFNGPSRVNSLGKAFMESVTSPLAGPVTVGADGAIAAGLQSTTALYHLRVRQTFEDKKRSALDAMAFTASVGVTTLLDQTLVAVATGPLDPQPTHPLATLNHYRMYDAWLELNRAGEAFVRLQINFLHNQGNIPALGDLANQLPELRERLKNQFPFFGNDLVRTGGIGEWAAPFALASTNPTGYAVWFEAQRLVAQARWRNENAQSSVANVQQVVETYEAMDDEFGITDLRWGLQHADLATEDQLARLRDLNVGVSLSGLRWQSNPSASGAPVGPFFPRALASGIHAGLHEDGVHIAPHNPWFALHYATTGLNFAGIQINPDQQISREAAMRAYTNENAWYLNREDVLGSIEVGKLADFVVLDRDYFSVSDTEARLTRPELTIVGGRVVYERPG